jgi:hypothetical protein
MGRMGEMQGSDYEQPKGEVDGPITARRVPSKWKRGTKGNKGSKGNIVYITFLSYVYIGTNAE